MLKNLLVNIIGHLKQDLYYIIIIYIIDIYDMILQHNGYNIFDIIAAWKFWQFDRFFLQKSLSFIVNF